MAKLLKLVQAPLGKELGGKMLAKYLLVKAAAIIAWSLPCPKSIPNRRRRSCWWPTAVRQPVDAGGSIRARSDPGAATLHDGAAGLLRYSATLGIDCWMCNWV